MLSSRNFFDFFTPPNSNLSKFGRVASSNDIEFPPEEFLKDSEMFSNTYFLKQDEEYQPRQQINRTLYDFSLKDTLGTNNFDLTSSRSDQPEESYISSGIIPFSTSTTALTTSVTDMDDPDTPLPLEYTQMSSIARNCVIAYCCLFCIAALGNIYVFTSVFRQIRHVKSRITMLIMHLSIADLMVTFIVMPLEIIWRMTVQWYGGNILCKLCQFFRAFGLYLSSMVVICISFDRFFAIIYPLKLARATNRVRGMLVCAWMSAIVFAAPQVAVFEVKTHPVYKSFQQCVTKGFVVVQSPVVDELLYTIFSVSALYFIPLAVIISTYSMILWKITRKSRQHMRADGRVNVKPMVATQNTPKRRKRRGNRNLSHTVPDAATTLSISSHSSSGTSISPQTNSKNKIRFLLRSTDGAANLARARVRTLRLTVVIVITFVLCWTPYVVMTLWYMFDRESAKKVDQRIQEALFIFAVSNSVCNPLIYGTYRKDCRPHLKSYIEYSCPCVYPKTRYHVNPNSVTENANYIAITTTQTVNVITSSHV